MAPWNGPNQCCNFMAEAAISTAEEVEVKILSVYNCVSLESFRESPPMCGRCSLNKTQCLAVAGYVNNLHRSNEELICFHSVEPPWISAGINILLSTTSLYIVYLVIWSVTCTCRPITYVTTIGKSLTLACLDADSLRYCMESLNGYLYLFFTTNSSS